MAKLNSSPRPSYLREAGETLKLAGPVILGHLGHMIIQQADTIMIGDLGEIHLAAATLANSIFFLPVVVGLGICMAIAPLVSQAIGANRKEELHQMLSQGFWVSFWSGVILVGLIFATAEGLQFLDQDPEVLRLAKSYMRIIGVSALPLMLFQMLKHYADGFEDVWPGMIFMGVIVLFNIFFNWLLIQGHLGFPALELDGAGWATLLARSLGVVAIVLFFVLKKKYRIYVRQFTLRHMTEPIERILKVGLPSGFQYLFEVGSFTGAVLLIGPLGPEVLSAHQIALGIPAIVYMAYMGISAAGSIRVGSALGKGDLVGLRRAGRAAGLAAVPFIVVGVLGMVLLNDWLPTLYIKEVEVQLIAANLVLIAALFQVADGIQAVFLGVLRGMEDVRIPTILTFIAYWVIGLPIGYALMEYMDLGVYGMWFGLTAGLAFSAIFLTVRFLQKSRRLPAT